MQEGVVILWYMNALNSIAIVKKKKKKKYGMKKKKEEKKGGGVTGWGQRENSLCVDITKKFNSEWGKTG